MHAAITLVVYVGFVAAYGPIVARQGGFPTCATKCDAGWCNKNAFNNGFSNCIMAVCSGGDLQQALASISTLCFALDVPPGQQSLPLPGGTKGGTNPTSSSTSPTSSPTTPSTSSFKRDPPSVISTPQSTTRASSSVSSLPAQSSNPLTQGPPVLRSSTSNRTLIAALVPSLVLGTALVVVLTLYRRRNQHPRPLPMSPPMEDDFREFNPYEPHTMASQGLDPPGQRPLYNADGIGDYSVGPNARTSFHTGQELPDPTAIMHGTAPPWVANGGPNHPTYAATQQPRGSEHYIPNDGADMNASPSGMRGYPPNYLPSPIIGSYPQKMYPSSSPRPHMSQSIPLSPRPGQEVPLGDPRSRMDGSDTLPTS